ncbi:MAG: hypothetical protein KIT36_22500 [Alphaproteobacteria bacterium]|nr:hypothetical protein [Alphaproteobacteria bacterium]
MALCAGTLSATPREPAAMAKTLAPSAQQLAQAAPEASRKLTGQAAMNALIGNTAVVTGPPGGKDVVWYFLPDGTVKGLENNSRNVQLATWKLDGEKLCFSSGGQKFGCFGIEVNGAGLILTNTDGKSASGTILKGNARNM